MARPIDIEYRTALLGALDKKALSTIEDINEHLKEVGQFKSYQSTRRMLLKLSDEGVISVVPKRLEKNKLLFTKEVFNPHLILRDTDGNLVTLSQFIANVYKAEFPEVISSQASTAIKLWMFDYIVGSDPARFKGIRETPNRPLLKKKLKETLKMLQEMHAFIKYFLDSDIHSPVAEQKIMRELSSCPDKQIEFLITKQWMDPSG